MNDIQRLRYWLRFAFFTLFVLAPPLDLFRLDLKLGHFILLGQHWTLGLDPFLRGEIGPGEASVNLILRGFVPIALIIGTGVWVSWKYGRLYCGWLCPHFSVVEMINALMRRAFGKPTLWEHHTLPETLPDGRTLSPQPLYWIAVAFGVLGFAFLWTLSLLTYLWPPMEVYSNLLHGTPSRFEFIFLTAGTIVFVIEFLLARHLFCRFGCAIGLFQSLAWMANKQALVVGFARDRVAACVACDAACDNACPMRLKPRSTKRHMFTCTQCVRCVQACSQVQQDNPHGPLLHWVEAADAMDDAERDFGRGGKLELHHTGQQRVPDNA